MIRVVLFVGLNVFIICARNGQTSTLYPPEQSIIVQREMTVRHKLFVSVIDWVKALTTYFLHE